MKNNSVLFQIKTLEKLIARKFLICNEIKDYHPIAPTQFQIIDYMMKNNIDEVYQKDLENILKLRRATVSGVLQTMERNGLISRQVDSEDTRTKKIILQISAKEMFNKKKKKIKKIEQVITKDISKEDLEVFSKVLNKMKNNIENVN